MRTLIGYMAPSLLLTAFFTVSGHAQEKPNDATLGAKPPEGATSCWATTAWRAG